MECITHDLMFRLNEYCVLDHTKTERYVIFPAFIMTLTSIQLYPKYEHLYAIMTGVFDDIQLLLNELQ